MAIRIVHGTPSAYTELGTLMGRAEKHKEEIARSEREIERGEQVASQVRSMAFQKEMAQMQEEKERRRAAIAMQMDLEGEQRARSWELDKMEMASRMDYQRQETKRQTELDNADKAMMAIDKEVASGRYSKDDPAIQKARFDVEMQKYNIDVRLSREEKPLTYGQQKNELESALELSSYTQQDLLDLGLNPAAFPGVPGGPAVTPTTGVTATNPKTGEKIISYDDGKTWQSIQSSVKSSVKSPIKLNLVTPTGKF